MQQQLSVNDLFPVQLLQALRTEAGLTDRDVAGLLPFPGAFHDLAALHQAKVFVLLELARPKDSISMTFTGPYPNLRISGYLHEKFSGLGDLLLQGIDAGVVVCLQAIPYGIDSSMPYANEVIAKLKKYYVKVGRQGQPHPGHERLFDCLEQLVHASTQQQQQQQGVSGQNPPLQRRQAQGQQQRLQAPLFVLGCGKEYWFARGAKQPAFMAAALEAQQQDGVQRVVMRGLGAPNQGWQLTHTFYAAEDLQKIKRVVTAGLADAHRAGPLPAAIASAAALAAHPAACNALSSAAAAAAAAAAVGVTAGAMAGACPVGQAAAALATTAPVTTGAAATTGALAGTATALVGVPVSAAVAATSGLTESVATAESLGAGLQEEVQQASSSKQQAGGKRPRQQHEQQRPRQRRASSARHQPPAQLQPAQADERLQSQQQQQQAASVLAPAPALRQQEQVDERLQLPPQQQQQQQEAAPMLVPAPAPNQQEQVDERLQSQQQQQAAPVLAPAPLLRQQEQRQQLPEPPAASAQPELQEQQQALSPQAQQQQQQQGLHAQSHQQQHSSAAAAAVLVLPNGYALEDFSNVPAALAQLPGLLRHLGAPAGLRVRLQGALMLQMAAGSAGQQPREDGSRLALLRGQYGLLQLCIEQRDVDMTRSSLEGLLTMLGA